MRVLERLLAHILGERCVGCRRVGACLCRDCLQGIPQLPRERCAVCSAPGPDPCPECRFAPDCRRIVAAAPYDGVVAEAVKALKYGSVASLAVPLGSLMAERLWAIRETVDALVPVPLSRARRRERGFNQAELLARALAGCWGIPVLDGMVRVRHTQPQTMLDAASRATNLIGAFRWHGPDLSALRVGVVDDVATTGATIVAVAKLLCEAGAVATVGLVVARQA